MPKLSDLQQGKVIDEPKRTPPASEDWWNVNAGINLSNFGYPDNFDATYPFILPFYIDKNVKKILEVGLTLKFQKFRTYTKPVAHSHTVTIAAHTHNVTLSDHTHSVTTSNHTHDIGNHTHSVTSATSSSTSHQHAIGSRTGAWTYPGESSIGATSTDGSHSHTVSSQTASSGGATTSSSGGGQSITSGSGGGTTVSSSSGGSSTPTSSATAGAEYGVFEDTYPADVEIAINGVDITDNLGGPFDPSVGDDTIYDLELTPFVTEGGLYILTLTTSQRGRCLPLLWVKSIITR